MPSASASASAKMSMASCPLVRNSRSGGSPTIRVRSAGSPTRS
jgi:hypothetical protein